MAELRQQIRFATAPDGVKIAFAESGSGPPLLRAGHWMTHLEWDGQTPLWSPLLQGLSARHRLVRYDLRGCGLSDRDIGAMSLDGVVSDLAAVADAAGLEHFALLGMSLGGAASVLYAARHPERVSRLVLLGSFARGALVRHAGEEQREVQEAMVRLVRAGWGRGNPAFRQLFTSQFFPGATREQAEGFNEMQRLSCSPAHAEALLRMSADIDVTGSLAQVPCPTLVLHCRGDARVPFEEGRFVAAGIPGALFEPLESINHVPLPGEPAFARSMALIEGFLTPEAARLPGLSARECELVELLAHGFDNAQIAARLELAEKTVRNNVSAVFHKLGVESRAQAIVRARDAGFGRAPR